MLRRTKLSISHRFLWLRNYMNVPSCFYERKCIRQFNNHAQFVQAVCLVEILIIVHFKHISLHSYNPPCLQDVCPAKQPLVRTALIVTDLLTRYEGRTLVVFGDEPFLSRVGMDEGGGGVGVREIAWKSSDIIYTWANICLDQVNCNPPWNLLLSIRTTP